MTCPSEHVEQRNFVSWFRQNHRGVLIFAIPNGGYRSKTAANKFKLEGVVSGIPDLFVPAWSLWIEMKRQTGGRLSPTQKNIIQQLQAINHTALVCKGCDDAIKQVTEYVYNQKE